MTNIYITGDKTPEELSEIFNGEAFTTARKDVLENSAQLNESGKLKKEQIPTTEIPILDVYGKIQESQLPESLDSVAHLDDDGKLTSDEIPEYLLSGMTWKRTVNVLTDTLDPIDSGNYYKVSVGGESSITGEFIDWSVGDWIIDNSTSHERIPNSVDLATTSDAGIVIISGDLDGVADDLKVVRLQGVDVSSLNPSDGDILKYSEDDSKYELTQESDNTIQGVSVSTVPPSANNVLMYSVDDEEYVPTLSPDNTIQGNEVADTVVEDKQVYMYDDSEGKFVAQYIPDNTINGIQVDVTQPTRDQVLAYDPDSDSYSPTDMGGTVLLPITAKSVVVDLMNNHGDSDYLNLRSIEFYIGGARLELTSSDFNAYSTSTSGVGFLPAFAFDTTLSKTGTSSYNQWATDNGTVSNQRLSVVFDNTIQFDTMVINNGHVSGAYTTRGAKDIIVYSSTDSVTSTVYGETVPDATLLLAEELPAHVSADVTDDNDYEVGETTGANNATSIQNINVSAITPTSNQVLAYDSGEEEYMPSSNMYNRILELEAMLSHEYSYMCKYQSGTDSSVSAGDVLPVSAISTNIQGTNPITSSGSYMYLPAGYLYQIDFEYGFTLGYIRLGVYSSKTGSMVDLMSVGGTSASGRDTYTSHFTTSGMLDRRNETDSMFIYIRAMWGQSGTYGWNGNTTDRVHRRLMARQIAGYGV